MVRPSLVFIALATLVSAGIQNYDSPVYKSLFQVPLPIPPIKVPTKVYTSNGQTIEYYEVEIKPLTQQVYPGLSKTNLVGYDGISPGPTFRMRKGTQAIVRFINHGTQASSIHLASP
ncbi:hypothetical protein LTR56_021114 [Elasticomyces elasticus]|nr:hypothetical protein LTR56_021114 [Elasticomyces elasticus]KAK3631925.1 hypothetical protein LTR22_020858 [Elasticomyces elasticus]KAK4909708.1 hypothetical protein LTR49_021520 [Elasticomyces elasticus]KAK5749587.1 hypothetical protein LTS12_020374 [Elasticomyces elasticus]